MDSMQAMQWSAILFCLGALGGLTIAVMRFSGRPQPPNWMAMGHGLVGLTGLAILGYAALTVGIPQTAQFALLILLAAAVGGATIFLRFHKKGLPLPIPFVIGHGVTAATGLVLLLLTAF